MSKRQPFFCYEIFTFYAIQAGHIVVYCHKQAINSHPARRLTHKEDHMIKLPIRLMSLILLLALCLPLSALGQAEGAAGAETADEAAAEDPAAFEYLKAAKQKVNMYYTPLRLPGFEHTVYAFTDKEGRTRFRVYGRLNGKRGMYEAAVNAGSAEQPAFSVTVTGEKPISDKWEVFAKAKAVKLDAQALPEGYKKSGKVGVMYFINLFRQKEYRVLGRLDNIENAYYPAVYAKPKPGSLAIDISRDVERFRLEGEKYYKLPSQLRSGFAIAVFITSSDGFKLSVMTDKPAVDRAALK